jgi:CheY-like chemotaxis protein
MRETLDCGVLMVQAHASWMREWMQRQGAVMSRVRLHAVSLDDGGVVLASGGTAMAYAGSPAAAQALARAAMSLRRFDACLLPVTPATLAWTRTALSCAYDALHTPLIGVAKDLKAAAVADLLALGMRDFVRDPLCPEELRVRLDRVATGKPAAGAAEGSHDQARYGIDAGPAESRRMGSALQEPGSHYGAGRPAAALRPGGGPGHGRGHGLGHGLGHGPAPVAARPRLSRDEIDNALLSIQAAPRIHPDEPFRIAKSRVVDSFERDYVRTALSRHAGNVARAARASAKHRRAFWALMRKHHIDAAPYRPRQDDADEEPGEM